MSLCTYLLAGFTHTYTSPRALLTLWTILPDMIFSDWNVTVLTWDVWKSVRLPVLAPKICHLKWNDMLQLQILVRYPKNWAGLILPLFYAVGVLPSLFELFFSLVDLPTFKIQTWTRFSIVFLAMGHFPSWSIPIKPSNSISVPCLYVNWAHFVHNPSIFVVRV